MKKNDFFFRRLSGQSSGLMVLLSVVLHSAIALIPLKKKTPDPLAQVILESPPAITVTQLPELPPPEVPKTVPESADSQPIPPQPVIPQPIPPQPVIPQPVAPNPAPPPVVAETSSDMPVENTATENTATRGIQQLRIQRSQMRRAVNHRLKSNEAKVAAYGHRLGRFFFGELAKVA